MNLDKNLEETAVSAEERRLLCEKLSQEKMILARSLEERDRELADTRGALAKAQRDMEEMQEELSLQKSVDEKLEEFSRQLSNVEEMKRRYERRIAYLEGLLKKSAERDSDDDELAIEDDPEVPHIPGPIDMTAADPAPVVEKTPGPERRKADNRATYLQRIFREKRAPGLPEKLSASDPGDDWLLDLPEDL